MTRRRHWANFIFLGVIVSDGELGGMLLMGGYLLVHFYSLTWRTPYSRIAQHNCEYETTKGMCQDGEFDDVMLIHRSITKETIGK